MTRPRAALFTKQHIRLININTTKMIKFKQGAGANNRKKLKPLAGAAAFRLQVLRKRKEKQNEVNALEQLLKPIQSLKLEDDSSSVSEISDIFEEFHRESFMKRQGGKYLTKHEADLKTFELFTPDFKRTISNIRENLQHEFYSESPQEIEKIIQNPPVVDVEFKKTIPELLTDLESISPPPSEALTTNSTSLSGATWHLLKVNFNRDKFHITPPVFDAFRQEAPHWLEKATVPWEELNESRVKCEKWLENYC